MYHSTDSTVFCLFFALSEDFMSAYSIDERTITRVNNKGKSRAESADISKNGHHHIINGQTGSLSGSAIVGGGKVAPHITHLPRPDACLPDGGAAQDGITSSPTDGSWSTPTDTLAISVTSTRWVTGYYYYYHNSIHFDFCSFFFKSPIPLIFLFAVLGQIIPVYNTLFSPKVSISCPMPLLWCLAHLNTLFKHFFFCTTLFHLRYIFVIGDCVEIKHNIKWLSIINSLNYEVKIIIDITFWSIVIQPKISLDKISPSLH